MRGFVFNRELTEGEYQEDVRLIRDCLAGNRRVKFQGEAYLPRLEGQSPQAYAAWKQRSLYFNIPKATLDLIVGRVFRKPTIFSMPDKMQQRPATPNDYSWEWLARELFREVMAVGRCAIVAVPTRDDRGIQSAKLVVYYSEDLDHVEYVGKTLTLVRVHDTNCKDDERIEFYLDERGRYCSRKVKLAGEAWMVVADEDGLQSLWGKALNYIPAWFITPEDWDHCPTVAPLSNLCEIAIGIYQLWSEYRMGLYYSASPQPVVYGFKQNEIPVAIGPATVWAASNENAKAELLVYSGDGLKEMREGIDVLRQQAAVAGASMLLPKTQAAQAARTVELNQRSEMALAVQCALSVSQAMTDALQSIAAWENLTHDQPISAKLNTDLVDAMISPQILSELIKGVQSGIISRQTFHENLQRGELIPTTRTVEEEKELTEEDALLIATGRE